MAYGPSFVEEVIFTDDCAPGVADADAVKLGVGSPREITEIKRSILETVVIDSENTQKNTTHQERQSIFLVGSKNHLAMFEQVFGLPPNKELLLVSTNALALMSAFYQRRK